MPPKEERAQFQVISDHATVHRLDALRIVMRISRAKVVNRALVAGLPALELENHDRLRRLYALGQVGGSRTARGEYTDTDLDSMLALGITGLGWRALVEAYAERNARKTYGETLEELERAAGIEVADSVSAA